MRLKAERIFSEYMENFANGGTESRFIVGVSGGADSVCLLFLMKDIFSAVNIRVIHVNHMIRGREADEDADFVNKICKEGGLYFKEVKKDVPSYAQENGLSEEEAGRIIRYRVFDEEALAWEKDLNMPAGSVHIAVAHHLEDDAETFLFNLFRGSGIAGLSGISQGRERIIRPLLKASRQDIEEYLMEKGQSFKNDRTNSDLSISRNLIRKVIIPEAEKICSASALHISRASEKLRDISDYLDEGVKEAAKETVSFEGNRVRIRKNELCRVHEVISSMLILRILTDMTPMKKDIGEVHVKDVLNLMRGPSGRHADLPYGIKADVTRDELILFVQDVDEKNTPDNPPSYNVVYMNSGDLTDEEKKEIFEPSEISGDYTKYFDYDKITIIAGNENIKELPYFEIRHRKQGDHLTIKKGNGEIGRKSLSDYLTDLKISAEEKDRIWVFAAGSEILWVVGYRMSDSAKIDDDTVNICRIKMEEEYGKLSY